MPRKRGSEDVQWYDRGVYDALTEARKLDRDNTLARIKQLLADPAEREKLRGKRHPGMRNRKAGMTLLDYAEWISGTKHWRALLDFKTRYL